MVLGLGGGDREFHQGHIEVHGAAIESWMKDDPLHWNHQSTHSRPNDWAKTYRPAGRIQVTSNKNKNKTLNLPDLKVEHVG